MKLTVLRHQLRLASAWKIARGATSSTFTTVVVKLEDADGVIGLGEGAPISRYAESAATVEQFCAKVDPARIRFTDVQNSQAYIASIAMGNMTAKCALNTALLDGAARRTRQTVGRLLGLKFSEVKHATSFSIGIADLAELRDKVSSAAAFPILKIKLGVANDREIFTAVREAVPDKCLRIDANEGWKAKEAALEMITWLAKDNHVEFVEQPLPASAPPEDWRWLKKHSPLPLFADESFHTAADAGMCAERFHGVNIKLVKTGGPDGALEALKAARKHGLQTMLGCMLETSVLISAAAQIAELADYCDLDGNLLVTNDPYAGVTAHNGLLSFAEAAEPFGLRVSPRD